MMLKVSDNEAQHLADGQHLAEKKSLITMICQAKAMYFWFVSKI